MKIETRDNLTVCVPDSLRCLTAYVLLEQEQWFDPEMELVRGYVKPGMTAVDIGAGFGAYSLILSKLTGNDGKTFAFEADPESADYLQQSTAQNNLENLEIIRAGVSDGPGRGRLHRAHSPEFNSVDAVDQSGAADLPLICLDEWWEDAGRPDIHLLKIDVNGHEPMVLQGARELLTRTSPLVLLAVNSPDPGLAGVYTKTRPLSLKIVQTLGYHVYAYLPGPGVLVAFDPSQKMDVSQLNLVACKPGLAGRLEQSGVLAGKEAAATVAPSGFWREYVSQCAFSKPFLPHWNAGPDSKGYMQGLDMLCAAQDTNTCSPAGRVLLLHKAAQIFNMLFQKGHGSGSLCFCLARACHELGYRKEAAGVIQGLVQDMKAERPMAFDLPFVSPVPAFDALPVRVSPQEGVRARSMESMLFLGHHSSWFMDEESQVWLSSLRKNPEISARAQRSLNLAALRPGTLLSQQDSPGAATAQQTRNAWFWCKAINDPWRLILDDQGADAGFSARILPRDLEPGQLRTTMLRLNHLLAGYPGLRLERIVEAIESALCPPGAKVRTLYSIQEGGAFNAGFFNHTVDTEHETRSFLTKIVPEGFLHSELAAYQEIFPRHDELRKYAPGFVHHVQSQCKKLHFLTMHKVRGRHATPKDMPAILEFFAALGVLTRDKASLFPDLQRPVPGHEQCVPNHMVMSTLFSHVHELDANRKIFHLMYDACRRNKLPGRIIDLVHRLERVIIAKRAFALLDGDALRTLAHGDFRRENILVDEQGRLVVIDWSHATIAPVGYDLALLFSSMNLELAEIDRLFFSHPTYGARLTAVQNLFFLYALVAFWIIFLNGDPRVHRHLAGKNYEPDLMRAVTLAEGLAQGRVEAPVLRTEGPEDPEDPSGQMARGLRGDVLINKAGLFIFDPRQFDYYQNIQQHMDDSQVELVINDLRDSSDPQTMVRYAEANGLAYTLASHVLKSRQVFKIIVGTGIFPLQVPDGQGKILQILPETILGLTSIRFPRGMDIPANHPADPLRRTMFDYAFCHGKIDKALVEKNTGKQAFIIGDPRYDNFPEYPEERAQAYVEEFGLDQNKPLIVWLSTRVDWQSIPDANITLWSDAFQRLHPHFSLVLRPHPHRVRDNPALMQRLMNSGLTLDLKAEREMNQIFKAADYIICDYGSSIFSAIYLDCNLLLFNHPEQQRTPKFLELKVRKDLLNLNPGKPRIKGQQLVEIFHDPDIWKAQEKIRKKWRDQLFGGIAPGQGGRHAATILQRLLASEDVSRFA